MLNFVNMETARLLFAATLLVFASACSGGSGEKVIAKVGEEKITEKYFEEKVAEISPNYRKVLDTDIGRRQFLDILINEKLVQMDARESDVGSSPKYVEKVGEMKKSLDRKLKEFENYLLTKMWIEQLKEEKIKVTEKEIREYFENNPYEIKLEQMIFETYEEADAVYSRVKKSPGLFAKMAKKKSLFPGAAGESTVISIMKGEFIPQLEDMAFKMKTGEIQGVVKSKYGYHLLHKLSRRKLRLTDEVKERAKHVLEKKKFDRYLAGLNSKHKVEVLDESFR